ncbi:hypothetical protein AMK59_7029 [Oryctes borbonicus]|uniref:SUI1 domain-containing protein n=1 Tax=Oryctes borbonicus TaxID=1629725 RepID=A0A0T6AU92_9SCAR|nr:hypothetical protein AMK59_7029 [Oryctes borbonicus]
MFKKPFKIKSNTQLKTTERKVLRETVLKAFPKLTEDDIDNIFPKKELAFCMKIVTSKNNTVFVYLVQKRAIVFDIDGILYPSIYLLWKYIDLIPSFTTNPFVISKIMNGADLMAPGVIRDPSRCDVFQENQVASINSNNNIAPIAVGITAISSHDLELIDPKGKCVIVYHVHGDMLCSLEDMPVLPVPNLGLPKWLTYSVESTNDFPPLSRNKETSDISLIEEVPETPTEKKIVEETGEEPISNVDKDVDEVAEMEKILTDCFLTAIKYSKNLELPMLTSSFYKLTLMPLCPPDKNLDIKKTSFKKVGQFLKHMEKEGLIVIKEKKKGVETLEAINYQHPTLLNFYVDVENRPKKPSEENIDNIIGPSIVESYVITNAVLPIFQEFGLKKSDTLTVMEIRKFVTTYVKSHDYQNKENQRLVNVSNTPFGALCKNENSVSWEELIEKVCSAMKSCFKVTSGHEETVSKGKIQPIVMSTQTRSGNKKVTLVDNLELFGIRMSEFAKECQHGVAASTSITKPPGKKSDQLLIQGNQILFVHNLLVNKYKIPKKYIKGLEHAPKVKK